MNNISIILLLLSCALIFVLPRRYVIITLLYTGILMGMHQRIIILTLDWTIIRILLLSGWLRLFIRSEYRSIKQFNAIDKIIIVYVAWALIAYFLLWLTLDALIYKLGFISYALGTYFLVRFYVNDLDDIEKIIKALLYLSIPLAIIVGVERLTQFNYLSFFGNVDSYTYIREGKVRCFGSFSHPITMGSFAAFLTPLAFYLIWKDKGNKLLGLASFLCSIVMVLCSSSSGPLFSLAASIGGLCMWRFRKYLRFFLWGGFVSIIGLHIVMKAPVWALINRVGLFSSSSTYHRFLIVDQLITNFSEWWLIGIQSTEHWSEYVQLTDVSNNYALVAVDGGIIALILFIFVIVQSFRHIRKMIALDNGNMDNQKLFWALGVGMFSYLVSFIGVSLWDQTIMIWYFLIATIASITYKQNTDLNGDIQSSNIAAA